MQQLEPQKRKTWMNRQNKNEIVFIDVIGFKCFELTQHPCLSSYEK
jgi:hypothetical protein